MTFCPGSEQHREALLKCVDVQQHVIAQRLIFAQRQGNGSVKIARCLCKFLCKTWVRSPVPLHRSCLHVRLCLWAASVSETRCCLTLASAGISGRARRQAGGRAARGQAARGEASRAAFPAAGGREGCRHRPQVRSS